MNSIYLLIQLRTHTWIQMTKVDSKLLESIGDIAKNFGVYYNTDDGTALEWPVRIFLTPLVCVSFCYR